MDTKLVDRDARIASVFASVVVAMDRLLSPLELTGEEAAELKEDLLLWFRRFCRRPGQERLQVRSLQLALIWAGWKAAALLWESKHHGTLAFPRDPEQIAKDLGILPGDARQREPQG